MGRRRLLASLGVGAMMAPFLPRLEAEAELGDTPKRLILFFHPHGVIFEDWAPTGTTNDWELSATLQPLAAHKERLIVLDGLSLPEGDTVGPPEGGPHTRNTAHLWSGAPLADDGPFTRNDVTFGWGIGTSIDQTVAEVLGAQSYFRSLEFGVRVGSGARPHNRMIYRAPGEPLEPIGDPVAAFNRIFGELDGDPQALDRLRASRLSALDTVSAELKRVRDRVSSADRTKMDAHLEAIRAMESRLNAVAFCDPPQAPMPLDPAANDSMPDVSRQQLELMVRAMACDLTRVASIQYDRNENSDTRFTWLFDDDRGHHSISHSWADRPKLTQIYAWYAGQLAYLMDLLEAVPEGDGTMLDNTLIVWGTEVGAPVTHKCDRMPFVLAGGVGGALEMNRFLSYEGVQHNRLLVSLANIMGLEDVQSYGTTDLGKGGLSGLV